MLPNFPSGSPLQCSSDSSVIKKHDFIELDSLSVYTWHCQKKPSIIYYTLRSTPLNEKIAKKTVSLLISKSEGSSTVWHLASPQTSLGFVRHVSGARIHFSPSVRGVEMNAWRTNPKGRLRGGYMTPLFCPTFLYCSQIWHHCGARNTSKLEKVRS